jgi:hypothetical protein
MKAGDVCVVDKLNGLGLTIRYLLPRTSEREGHAEADDAAFRVPRE